MIADSDSNIAWHRAQLKKNRDAVKAMENARFTIGEVTGSSGRTKKIIASLKRKIAESERCIAAHERRTKRPVATDLRSLASVSWSSWNTHALGRRCRRRGVQRLSALRRTGPTPRCTPQTRARDLP